MSVSKVLKGLSSATKHHIKPSNAHFVVESTKKICNRIYSEQYKSCVQDVETYTGKPKSGKSHNGDYVREAYHKTLHHLDLGVQQKQFHSLWGEPTSEEHHVSKAFAMHTFRETTRMTAWAFMDPKDVAKLKVRNQEKYGREEGPSFEYLVEKQQSKNPSMELEKIMESICDTGLYKTSAQYDEDYGIVQIPIQVHPGGRAESHDMRKERLDILQESPKFEL